MSQVDAQVVSERAGFSEHAGALGILDAFVFRRVSATQWVHLGGLGRGRGWAGLVDIDASSDPLLAEVPSTPGGVRTFEHVVTARVMGPYYGVGGAIVRISNDVFVLLGHPDTPLATDLSLKDLSALAFRLEADLVEI